MRALFRGVCKIDLNKALWSDCCRYVCQRLFLGAFFEWLRKSVVPMMRDYGVCDGILGSYVCGKTAVLIGKAWVSAARDRWGGVAGCCSPNPRRRVVQKPSRVFSTLESASIDAQSIVAPPYLCRRSFPHAIDARCRPAPAYHTFAAPFFSFFLFCLCVFAFSELSGAARWRCPART